MIKWIIRFALLTPFLMGDAYAQAAKGIKSSSSVYDPGMRPDELPGENKPGAEELAGMHTHRMKKDLNLSPGTEKKVGAINLRYERQAEEYRKNSPDMNEYDKLVLSKIYTNRDEELKKELTDEQWFLYVKKQKDWQRMNEWKDK